MRISFLLKFNITKKKTYINNNKVYNSCKLKVLTEALGSAFAEDEPVGFAGFLFLGVLFNLVIHVHDCKTYKFFLCIHGITLLES